MILSLNDILSGTVAADGTKTGQAVTSTAISGNVIDLRNAASPATADEAIQGGVGLWLVVQTLTAFTTGTSATLTITLESAADAGLTSGPVVHSTLISGALVAALPANTVLSRLQLPSADYKRYLGLRYTVGVGTMTAGTIHAFLTPDIQRNVNYPTNYTV